MFNITKKEYIDNFLGFSITDMSVSHTGAYFITLVEIPDLSEDAPFEEQLKKEGDLIYRFLYMKLEGKHYLTYMEINPFVNRALITTSPDSGWVSVDYNGYVWEARVQELKNWPGYKLESDSFSVIDNKKLNKSHRPINLPQSYTTNSWLSHINELSVIDGDIYVCGGVRKVLRRKSYNNWDDLSLQKDHPQLRQDLVDLAKNGGISGYSGFLSVDGFSANDIYACGSKGDCWHYNRETWSLMDIPTNKDLNKIVCASDGYVYIASRDGLIIKGRGATEEQSEHWVLLQSDIEALSGHPFEGAVWFKNKLYVSTSYGLYELQENKLKKVNFGDQNQFSCQKLTANDDVLISFGPFNALAFDGKNWSTIISGNNQFLLS